MLALSRFPACRAALLTACAGVFAVCASPADAKSWQKHVVADCSGTSSNCSAKVYKVRKKKKLEITNVNCATAVDPSGVPFFVRMRRDLKGGGSVYDYYLPVATQDGTIAQYSVVNAQTRFVANAGDTLTIQASAQTDMSALTCHIAGNLTKK